MFSTFVLSSSDSDNNSESDLGNETTTIEEPFPAGITTELKERFPWLDAATTPTSLTSSTLTTLTTLTTSSSTTKKSEKCLKYGHSPVCYHLFVDVLSYESKCSNSSSLSCPLEIATQLSMGLFSPFFFFSFSFSPFFLWSFLERNPSLSFFFSL